MRPRAHVNRGLVAIRTRVCSHTHSGYYPVGGPQMVSRAIIPFIESRGTLCLCYLCAFAVCTANVAVAVDVSMCLCLCSCVNAHVTHPCSPGGRVFVRASVTSVIVDDSGTARGVVMADGSKVMAKRGVISNAGAQHVSVRVGNRQLGVTWCVCVCSSSRRSQYVHEARSAASSSPRERQGHQEQRRGE